jgi:hypothetical protein
VDRLPFLVVGLLHLEVDPVDRLPFLVVGLLHLGLDPFLLDRFPFLVVGLLHLGLDPFLLDLDLEPLLHHPSPLEEAFEHLEALLRDHAHLLEASLDHPYLHMHHPLVVVDSVLADTQQDHLVVLYTHQMHRKVKGNLGLQEEASFHLPYRDNCNLRQQIPDPYRP